MVNSCILGGLRIFNDYHLHFSNETPIFYFMFEFCIKFYEYFVYIVLYLTYIYNYEKWPMILSKFKNIEKEIK